MAELLDGSVKKRFLHWVRDAQRLPVDMSALQYYEEMVRQVLAPRLQCEGRRNAAAADDAHDVSSGTKSGMQVVAASTRKPLDEEDLRVYVAQNMLEELRGPGDWMLKRLHRSLESFLGLDLPHPLARRGIRVQLISTMPPNPTAVLVGKSGEEGATGGAGASVGAHDARDSGGLDSAIPSAAMETAYTVMTGRTGSGRKGSCYVMSGELRVGFREYLTEQVQMTEENAAACVLKVDRAMQHVLERESEELLLDGEETVVTAEQLGSMVMHFYEPLALHLAEEHLAWVAQHLRRYASYGGVMGRVLDDLFRESFCGWLVRERHVPDARTALVWVDELEALLRPFLGRAERHISVDRAKEVMRRNIALIMAHERHMEQRKQAQQGGASVPIPPSPPALDEHWLSPVERHFQVFLGLAPSSVVMPTVTRVKRRLPPTDDVNRSTVITPDLRNEFFKYLTQSRRLADVTAAVVVADLDRMMEWCLRRISCPIPPSDAKPASTPVTSVAPTGPSSASDSFEGQVSAAVPLLPPPLPPLQLPPLPLDRDAAKRLLQSHSHLGVEYVAMRRREGRQSSILPHLQAFLQLPITQIKGPKRARVDSIISPQLREEFMKWLQEDKRLSAKCSKNYLGEISAMLKHLVQLVLPEEDVHQLLLDKEHVKDMVSKHRPQLEQVVDERRKAGKLRDAAVMWLNVFLGIKPDNRASATNRRPLISMKEVLSGAGSQAGPMAVPGAPENAQLAHGDASMTRGGQEHGQEAEQEAHEEMEEDDGEAESSRKRPRADGGISHHTAPPPCPATTGIRTPLE